MTWFNGRMQPAVNHTHERLCRLRSWASDAQLPNTRQMFVQILVICERTSIKVIPLGQKHFNEAQYGLSSAGSGTRWGSCSWRQSLRMVNWKSNRHDYVQVVFWFWDV